MDKIGKMNEELLKKARAARGFMPEEEGMALYEAALLAPRDKPLLEIGSYCGKSAIYLGAAARKTGQTLFCVDHHRGSEENQAGWEHHEPDLVDEKIGRLDTLPTFRHTIYDAELEDCVIAVVGDSLKVAENWNTPLGFLFIDGGHGEAPAHNDYEAWTPKIAEGGLLAIHDVFPDPADGGRPPFEIYTRALKSGSFTELTPTASLRILQRI